ncbi:DUF2194 domain-containing protein [Paenibacillus wynnii]|uniref:DUF2194 domain-containing protein n=1 Tax=Paenibacillus wynnii TaxID=268407 RepID=UPI0027909955|nr:DUF2194 domain-containing protein [Paenibacillus wynnii]MDQ0193529.1 hypothetical protein [Paenibacillus wynnii]
MKLNFRIYTIIAGIVLLTAVMYLTHIRYFQQFSHNRNLETQIEGWKNGAIAPADSSGAPFCLAYDSEDPFSARVNGQTNRVLRDMRKTVGVTDLRKNKLEVSGCTAVILSVQDLSLLREPSLLNGYLEQGGNIFLTILPKQNDAFYQLYRKLGIINVGALKNEVGIRLIDEVLLGEAGLQIDDSFINNTVMQVELDSSARIHATTLADTPLLWSFSVGKGEVMVFNGTMLQEKISRGIIAGGVSMLMPDFIYPIFNSKLMYIDGWPAPYGNSIDPHIYEIYKLNRQDFFKQIWWPDMLKAAKRYGLKYTAVTIESYEDQVKPPFNSPSDADAQGLISYGREIIKSGGEIGLHGYNHQSLTTDSSKSEAFDYAPWESESDMAQSVKEAVNFVKRSFPDYTMFSYVPPSNVLSPEGRAALKQGWGHMAVISSVFGEDATGNSYEQEFEQAKDGILDMPRVTSGYNQGDYERWTAANVLTVYGFFSHFVYPYDVLDSDRNSGNTWEEMYDSYSGVLSHLQESYPWLRAKTSVEAAMDMKNLMSSHVELQQSAEEINGKVTPFQRETFFVLRTHKKIDQMKGCEAKKMGEGILLITVTESSFTIHFSEA